MTQVLRRICVLLLLCAMLLPRLPGAGAPLPTMLTAVAGILPGGVHGSRQASLPASQPLHLAIGLAPRNPDALRASLAALYNPSSPAFHHFLSPAVVAARFGPDPSRVSAFTAWLIAQHLKPLPWHGGMLLDVLGTARTIGSAFQTHLSNYRFTVSRAIPSSSGGRPASPSTGYAPDTVPLLPGQFSSLVTGIAGLSGVASARATAYVSLPATGRPADASVIGYSPAQVTTAYGFQPLYATGLHGEHLRVAMVELAPYQPADVAAYFARFGPGASITSHVVDGGNDNEPSNVEATLDLELLGPSVPGTSIDVYNAPNDASGSGLLDAYSAVASAGNANVLMLTWVHCEPEAQEIDGFVQVQHTLFQTLALQGTTVVAATGDAGAYGCSDGEVAANDTSINVTRPAVSLPASDPYVLAVAATDAVLSTGQTASIISESAWSCPVKSSLDCAQFGYKGGGSGGGLSSIFRTGDAYRDDLSWQLGPGVSNAASNGYREVPDVAISGSYGVNPSHDYSVYWQGTWRVGGGTSAAVPFWSALVLLADQYMLTHGGEPIGWINPLLYRISASPIPYPPFHDITTGNNLLYPATPGWDYASGWGTPYAWYLVQNLGSLLLGSPARVTNSPIPAATSVISATSTLPLSLTLTSTNTLSPTAIASSTPSATLTPPSTPTASSTVRATRTPHPSSSPTATPTSSPTARRKASDLSTPGPKHPRLVTPTPLVHSRHATPTVVSPCPAIGIGNGAFAEGKLTCWHAQGAILPRIVTNMPTPHHYSVQIGDKSAARRALSELSQSFLLPANRSRLALHVNFWLDIVMRSPKQRAAVCRFACAPASPAYPRLTITGPATRPIAQTSLLPKRTGMWSGLRVPLVACPATKCPAERLTLRLTVPPQPPGIGVVLYIDNVQLGT